MIVLASAWVAVLLQDAVLPSCAQESARDTGTNSSSIATVDRMIREHFASVTPELLRYSRITTYGETWQQPDDAAELIQIENRLLEDLLKRGVSKENSQLGFALIHNVTVMDHVNCQARLVSFASLVDFRDQSSTELFRSTLLIAGESGEAAAVELMMSGDVAESDFGRRFIKKYCIYSQTMNLLKEALAKSSNDEIRASLIYAISSIGDPREFDWTVETAMSTSETVQSASFFAAAELGRTEKDLDRIKAIAPVGQTAEKAKLEGLEWLGQTIRNELPIQQRITNDSKFVKRFGDLNCPTIAWIREVPGTGFGLPNGQVKISFDDSRMAQFMELLFRNKGFGLEAVKGDFAMAVTKNDIPALLEIRRLGFISPNELSYGRQQTLDVLIRYLRHASEQ